MKTVPGWNPIEHECGKQGCWNELYRPRIEFFAGALPRTIGMSDVDAMVEVGGRFLFLEWKSFKGEIPTGQRICFKRLTESTDRITVIFVHGGPTFVEHIMRVKNGRFSDWEECDLEELVALVAKWAAKHDIRAVGKATSLPEKAA